MKLMMYAILLSSTIMTISSSNMLMMWLCLELNLFSFIPLLLKDNSNNTVETSMLYFLAQTLGSTLFLLSNTMSLTMHMFMKHNMMILMISMMMKLGVVPCHHWYPVTMAMISWTNCFILSTWQKLAPLSILMYMIMPNMKKMMPLMLFFSSMNALVGGLMGLSEESLKKIMAYSSIGHMGWMLSASIMQAPYLSISYLSMYSLMIFPLFTLFNMMNSNKIYDLWHSQHMPMHLMVLTSMMLLSLSGMPPMTGFIPKLLMLKMLMNYSIWSSILLIMGSLMNLFFYLNISLNMLLSNQHNHTNKTKNKTKKSMISIMMTLNLMTPVIVML